MKTELASIANQYAQAILDLAVRDNAEDPVLADLDTINGLVRETPDFSVILNHPAIPSSEKKELLVRLFQDKVGNLTLRLLELLSDKRRLDILAYVESEYRSLLMAHKNIMHAEISTATPLNDVEVALIRSNLQSKLGQTFTLDIKEDRSLIGGIVLRVGDQVIDGSLRGRLASLKKTLLAV